MDEPLILHIDDSELVLQIVGKGLRTAGFRVVSVSAFGLVPEALGAHGMPDLILLDIRMPGVQGDDLARFFKTQWRLDTPIVLFSDLPAEEIHKRVESAGASAGVRKHEGLPALVRKLRSLLPDRPAPSARRSAPDAPNVPSPAIPRGESGSGNGSRPARPAPSSAPPEPSSTPADNGRSAAFAREVADWAARVRELLGGDLSAEGWRDRLPGVREELNWLRGESKVHGSPLARRLARAAAKAFANPDSADPGAREVLAAFITIMTEVANGKTRRGETLLQILRGNG